MSRQPLQPRHLQTVLIFLTDASQLTALVYQGEAEAERPGVRIRKFSTITRVHSAVRHSLYLMGQMWVLVPPPPTPPLPFGMMLLPLLVVHFFRSPTTLPLPSLQSTTLEALSQTLPRPLSEISWSQETPPQPVSLK